MHVLVIPDVHMKTWLFDKADKIMKSGKADKAVCLMDLPDDWGMENEIDRYQEIFDRAVEFAKRYPNTLWCYGNHDISYVWDRMESGFSVFAEKEVVSSLKRLEEALPDAKQIAFVHRINHVLFVHGGITVDAVYKLNPELLDADIDDVISAINNASVGYQWDDGSPLWFRPQLNAHMMFRENDYVQVVGHTPVEAIYEENGVISTDVFSTDPYGNQIGESAMIVIDTVSGEYEKIFVG